MDTGLALTIARLRGVHDGDPWHGPATLALLEDVSAADAAARPVEGAHSIWELVRHMTAWAEEARKRVLGGEPADEGVVAHHAYHAGQMALLKRALSSRSR